MTFFLLNLPMPHINVVVPPPAGVEAGTAPHQLVLELPDAGGYQLNGQPVPDDEFDAVMHAALEIRPVKLLFVAPGAGAEVVAFMPAPLPGRRSP